MCVSHRGVTAAQAAREIANTVAKSGNALYLSADSLLLGLIGQQRCAWRPGQLGWGVGRRTGEADTPCTAC
jgi:hypothetical protein